MSHPPSYSWDVLWVCQVNQRPAVIMPDTDLELVDINHPTATEIQL